MAPSMPSTLSSSTITSLIAGTAITSFLAGYLLGQAPSPTASSENPQKQDQRIELQDTEDTTPPSSSSSPPPPPTREAPLTYAHAGVSISSGNDLVTRISPLVAQTRRPGSAARIGGFGGLFSLPQANYPADSPTLVLAIDGIGTKLLLALTLRDVSTIGIDLVAMNVNDLLVQGAEPLAFLDYYACGKLDVDTAATFVRGVVTGCKEAGCALVGGETAEMPDLYGRDGEFDAAGAAVGALASGRPALPLTGDMEAGDVLLGLASSGCHSNGFSLVRKIVARSARETGVGYASAVPWDGGAGATTLGAALLAPTRIYVRPVLSVLRDARTGRARIKGMAHITGGGLVENIPRMLPARLAARVDARAWGGLPGVFGWLMRAGRVEAGEMVRTFNCGVGLVLVVTEGEVEEVMGELEESGERCWRIGGLVGRGEGEDGCVISGLETW